jgi:glycosyltransferase involved in cell wall biosynthesis
VLAPQFLAPLRRKVREDDAFVFLSVGNLIPVKGHLVLLEAFAAAARVRPGIRLRIGGDGELERSLEASARELGISGQVSLVGRLSTDRVVDEMDACDAFVLPSLVETFGVVVIEALARGKPVVATRCGGPESIVTPSDGLLVPLGNAVALADALVSMTDRANQYDPSTLRGNALRRFGPAEIARQLSAIYSEAVANA